MTSRSPPKQLRGERFVEKVFNAAAAEVARLGHQDISIEEVAARAGVNKTSIYRRWATPDGLVLEMFERGAEDSHRPPDTGTLRGDLLEYTESYVRIRHEPVTLAIVRMYITSRFKGKLGELLQTLVDRDHRDVTRIFRRAKKRGELPPGASAELGYELIHGVALELTLGRGGATGKAAVRRREQLVHAVIVGVASVAELTDAQGAVGG